MNMDKETNTMNILIVEDNEFDREAAQRAFKKCHIENPIYQANDGVEALEILKGPTITQPCLILLDINMPRMDGWTFLNTLRSEDLLKRNLVFILTTSARDKDITTAYNMNVAGYFVKKDLQKLVEMLSIYCVTNKIPTALKH